MEKGVSMASLVVTIVVIIILFAIAFSSDEPQTQNFNAYENKSCICTNCKCM